LTSSLVDIFGPLAVLVVLVLWLAIIAGALLAPFAMFSVAASLRGIRRELGRMNGDSVASRGGLFPNATVRHVEQPAQSLGHQLLK
jgi:hypothetical protein